MIFEILTTILAVGTLNIACFFIGAKVGQMVRKDIVIPTPTLNPVKIYEEHKEKKKADKDQEKLENILHNLDAYDGTSNGQRDI